MRYWLLLVPKKRKRAARRRDRRASRKSRRAPGVSRLYRDARGRFVSERAAKEIAASMTEVRRTRSGRVASIRSVLDHTESVMKMTERGVMDRRGAMKGRIDQALYATNITTVRNARRVEFIIRGKDRRDKEHRFKGSIDIDSDAKRQAQSGYIVGTLIGHLRSRGYRTAYKPSGISEARYRTTKDGRKKELHDVQITVRVLR